MSHFLIIDQGDPDSKIRYSSIPWSAMLPIIFSGLAPVLRAFQFNSGLRKWWTNIHRNGGLAYVIFVLIGVLGGLSLAWYAPHNPATRLGFASLAVVWFYSAGIADMSILAGNIPLQRQWMIRSNALTLAAVTLRLHLLFFQGLLGLSFDEAYGIAAWFCWIPNPVVAEWFSIKNPSVRQFKECSQQLDSRRR